MYRVFFLILFTLWLAGCNTRQSDPNPNNNMVASLSTSVATTAPEWIYIDKAGQEVIKTKACFLDDFHEGIAAVKTSCTGYADQLGYIDNKGTYFIEPSAKNFYTGRFSGGVAVIDTKLDAYRSGYVVIDKSNDYTFEPGCFSKINNFSEGLAWVEAVNQTGCIKHPATAAPSGYYYGFINTSGNWVIPPKAELEHVSDAGFREGLAAIKVNSKWGFIDKTGKFIIPPKFPAPDFENFPIYFSNGLAPIFDTKKKLYGFINKRGTWAIPPRFQDVRPFSEGLAAYKSQNEKWGFIDKSGHTAISPEYNNVTDFSEGLAGFSIETTAEKVDLPVFKYSKLPDFSFCPKLEPWGYINPKGEIIIKPKFAKAKIFSEGLAAVDKSRPCVYETVGGNAIGGMEGVETVGGGCKNCNGLPIPKSPE